MADDPVEALLRKAGDTATIDPVDALLAKAEGGAPAAMPDVSHLGPSTRANQEATQRAEARRTAGSGFGNLAGSGMYEAQPVNREDLLTGQRPLTQPAQMDPVTMTTLATADATERIGRRIVQGVTEPIRHAAEVGTVAGWIEGASGAALGALMASNPAGVLFSVSGAAHEAAAEGEAQGVGNDSILGRVAAAPHGAIEAGMGLLPDFEKQAEESRAIRMHPRADAETRLEASMTENLSRFGSMGKNALVIALFGAAHEAAPRVGGSILDAVTLRGQAKPGVPQGGVYGDAVPRTPHIADTPHSPIGVLESPNAAPVDAVGTRPSRAFPNRTTASLAEGQIPGPVPEGGRTVPVSQPEPPSAGLSLFTDESMTRQASPMRPRGRASRGAGEQGQQALLTPDAYASQGLKRAVEKAGFPSVLDAMRAWNEGDPLPQMKPEFIKELGKLADTYPRAGAVEYGTPRSAAARIKPSVGTEPTAPVSTPGARPLPNPDVWYEGPGGPEAFGPGVPNYPRTGEIVAPPTAGTTARPRPGTGRGFSLTTEDLMRRAAGEDQFPTTRQVDPRHDPNFRGKAQSPSVETGAPWQVDLAPGATQVRGRARFDPTTKISIEDVTPGAVTERPTGRGAVQPPAGEVSGTAPRKPPAARSEPIDLEDPPASQNAPQSGPGGPAVGVVDRIRSYGAAGEELGLKAIDTDVDVRRLSEPRIQKLLDAWGAMTKDERKAPRDLYDQAIESGNWSNLSPAQQNFVRAQQQVFTEGEAGFHQSGGRVQPSSGPARRSNVPQGRFTPHDMTPEFRDALEAGDPAAVQAWMRVNVGKGNPYQTPQQASTALQYWRDNLRKPSVSGVEFERQFNVPPEGKNPDILSASLRHVHDQALAEALQTNFKLRDPVTGELRNGGQGDIGDLISKIQDERGQNTAKWVRDQLETVIGRDPRRGVEHLNAWGKFQAREGVVTNVTKLGGAVTTALSQPSQIVNTAGVIGSKNAVKGFVKALFDPRASRRTAVESGAAPRMGRYQETAGIDTPTARLGAATDQAVNVAVSPVAVSDAAMRTVASAGVDYYAQSLRETLSGSGAAAEVRQLRKMGMRPEEIDRFRTGAQTPRDLTKLRQRVVSESNIEARASNLPAFMSDPNWQSAFRLKKFQVGQTRFYLRNVLDEAAKGNLKPLARTLAWSTAVGEGLATAKEQVTGPTGRRKPLDEIIADQDGEALFTRLVDDLDNAAFLGIIGTTTRAIGRDVVEGQQTTEKGEKRGISALGSHTATAVERLLTPPAVDTAIDLVNTATHPTSEQALKLASEQLSAWRQAASMIRLNSTDGLIEEIEKYTKQQEFGDGMSLRVPKEGEEIRVKALRERLRKRRGAPVDLEESFK